MPPIRGHRDQSPHPATAGLATARDVEDEPAGDASSERGKVAIGGRREIGEQRHRLVRVVGQRSVERSFVEDPHLRRHIVEVLVTSELLARNRLALLLMDRIARVGALEDATGVVVPPTGGQTFP